MSNTFNAWPSNGANSKKLRPRMLPRGLSVVRKSWNPTVELRDRVSSILRLQGNTPSTSQKHSSCFFAFRHAGSGIISRDDASMAGCHFAMTCLKIGPSLDSDSSFPKQEVSSPASRSAVGGQGRASPGMASSVVGIQLHRLFFCSPTDDHCSEHHDARVVSTSAKSTVISASSHRIVPSVRQKGQD